MARSRRSLRRHDAPRPAERRLLIVTEGTATEPLYFNDFVSRRGVTGVEVRVFGVGMDPVSLVERAIRDRDSAAQKARRQRDGTLSFDEVWCVFDVDSFGPKVNEARELARANDLHVAVSNPCFELWLILHLQEPPGPLHRHDLQARFQTMHPAREKYFDGDVIFPGYDDAVRRAERLDRAAVEAGTPGRNPTTGVHLLTESIDRDARGRREQAARDRLESALLRQRAREEAALAQARDEGWQDDDDGAGNEGDGA